MARVVGIRFKKAGKIYHFDAGHMDAQPGDTMVVDTARGIETGTVATPPEEIEPSEGMILRPVIRQATSEDLKQIDQNRMKSDQAFALCLEKIRQYGLDMHLVDAEYTFDCSKIIFSFTAENRVDFRVLVKDLASQLRTRIEMRQIGVRDEAKLLGGIGPCGRILCCTSFLTEFAPISIKMAKDQNLSLNPAKISGACGRLMCCLRYENEGYKDGSFEAARNELLAKRKNELDPLDEPLIFDPGLVEFVSTDASKFDAPDDEVVRPVERPAKRRPPRSSTDKGAAKEKDDMLAFKAQSVVTEPVREQKPAGGKDAPGTSAGKAQKKRRRRRRRRPDSDRSEA